jgi:hypothetical protein
MERDPVQRQNESDDPAKGKSPTRGYWFASQLGEDWQQDGDGIYHFVGPEAEDKPPEDPAVEAAASGPAESEELGDALDPARQQESSADKKPAKKAKRAGLLRRKG